MGRLRTAWRAATTSQRRCFPHFHLEVSADAGEAAISAGAASNTDNTASVAMPDDFVLQRIPSLLSARNLGPTRLTPNRRTHKGTLVLPTARVLRVMCLNLIFT